ncbi:unnamed protein product, partial [marine sediment metagenome]
MSVDGGSRRRFLENCLYLAVAGCGYPILYHLLGCKREERAKARISADFVPAYVALHKTGELSKRGQELWSRM